MPNADPAIIQDPARLEALAETGLLDTPVSPALERLTRLTTRLLGVPTAVVSLVDRNRQFFAAHSGLAPEVAEARQTPLSHSFCQHVVATAAPLVVGDAKMHPLVSDNLAIPDLGIQAYAGVPLQTSDGKTLGSFCVFDGKPREWSEDDLSVLKDLATAAMTEIELRFASRLLEEQESQLRELLDHTDQLVARVGVDGAIRYANAAWRAVLGDVPAEPAADSLRVGLATDGREAFDAAWDAAVAGEPSDDVEATFIGPEGQLLVVELRLVPRVVHGSVRGIRIFGMDVTELRRAEEARAQMIGIVSHELRTPIGAVRGALQLLDRLLPEPLGQRERDLLALASRNTDRLLALVNDLLDLDKLESGQLPLTLADHDLADVFLPVRDATMPQAEKADVTLTFTPGTARVRVDAHRVAQVLINLVGNAIKFTPAGGRVDVDADFVEGFWQVRVQDTGRGIPQGERERIFERFSQTRITDATEKGGTGLGLAIARAIVLQHGGRIWVDAPEEGGSCFQFTLPAAE